MNLKIPALFISLTLISTASFALDTETYAEMRQNPKESTVYALLESHIAGLAEGFQWANAHLEATKQAPIFCAPRAMALNAENYMQVVDEFLSLDRRKYVGPNVPLGGTLLIALQAKLPCK